MIAWNGNLSNGELPFVAREEFINVLEPIMLGNTLDEQNMVAGNRLLNNFTRDVEAYVGSQVPVERFNVRFAEAGFTSDSYEFAKNTKHFEFAKEDFKVRAFSYTLDQKLQAETDPAGFTAIMAEAARKMEKIMNFYTQRYLTYMRVIALITGSSGSLSVPSVNAGGAYTDNVGALRGEDMTDLLMPTVSDKAARYHYRAKAGATLSVEDIFTCQKMIKEYTSYSGMGVLGIANSKTLFDLRNILNAAESKDSTIPLELPISVVAGVAFTEMDLIPDGKILFVDAGVRDLLLNAVNPVATQRGLAIINEGASSFNTLDEFDGTAVYIWKHGYHVFMREKLLWLDITTVSPGSGLMSATGVTELETWAKNLRAGITGKTYVL